MNNLKEVCKNNLQLKVNFFGAFGNLKNYLHLREKQCQEKIRGWKKCYIRIVKFHDCSRNHSKIKKGDWKYFEDMLVALITPWKFMIMWKKKHCKEIRKNPKQFCIVYDTPPSSLMDSIVAPKVKTLEGEGVGARSLVHNTLGVQGCVGALGWD
jgi:hypothetical protein